MEYDPKEMNDYPHAGNARSRSLPIPLNVPSFHNMGDVVRAVFRVYRDNFLPLAKIVAVLTVPLVVVQHFFLQVSGDVSTQVIIQLSGLIGESLMSGALIYAVVEFLRGGVFPTLADSYGWGFKRWGRVLLCSFLYRIIIMLGFAFLIVPGIIFSVMFSLVVPVAVIEDTTAKRSFSRSENLTKNHRLQIFFTYFVFSIIIILVSLLTSSGFGGNATVESSLPFALVQGLITQLLESSSIVLTLFIYLGILRDVKPLTPQFQNDMPAAPLRYDPARPSQVEIGREL
jgi:hypothetical protein